ncbi:MAG TPA: hypothetical protein VKU80_16530 [Planctomycetota bacterium]|nr:hypothetical protein [Planctomycetota bacterium]
MGSHIFFVLFTVFWSLATVKSFSATGLVAYLMGVSSWSLLQAAYFLRRQPSADPPKPVS